MPDELQSEKKQPPHTGLWLALIAALALKLVVLLSNVMTFNTDEAMLPIMARHILRGARPIFYYGQAYNGTLEAYLIALAFAVFPQTVLVSRLVLIPLYLAIVWTTYLLAYRLSEDRFAAMSAALLTAIPSVMMIVYTTVPLGAYVEILLLDNLLWLIGFDLITGRKQSIGWWLLAGLLAGIGWWEQPLIITSLVPLVVIGAWRCLFAPRLEDEKQPFLNRVPWKNLGLVSLGFVAGAVPWIIGFSRIAGRILSEAGGSRVGAAFAEGSVEASWLGRVISVLFFNLPALIGLRPSWSIDWIALPVGVVVAAIYLFVLVRASQWLRDKTESDYLRVGAGSLIFAILMTLVLLIATPFAADPSGRYVMWLYPPFVILVGVWLGRLRKGGEVIKGRAAIWLAPAILALMVGYNLTGTIRSMIWNPPGISTQYAEIARMPHEYDDDLIDFLDSIGVDRGYSNIWVTFRFAFLTDERIILAPLLPYHEDMSYTTLDNKYPPYTELVREADEVVYVTANHPALDEAIRARFAEMGIAFKEKSIGPYTVFYDLPYPVTPEELGPFGDVIVQETYDQ
ncbi:MAG: glycosyltransferase family 39 protein [Anaerolineae bacterium]|nr:glycosyltransferase family 39 protein [Anaerolineae bacterium]